ncbi:MAG: TldD/PmbA family protein [bacterium]|nr:TldD/PmbA family protein [bacterium]
MEEIKELFLKLSKEKGVRYGELRIEESEITSISFRGKELEELSVSKSRGGNIRILGRYGWGFVSFNEINYKSIRDYFEQAYSASNLILGEDLDIEYSGPTVDRVIIPMEKDFREIPLEEKKRLLSEYNDIMLNFSPKIQSTQIRYSDRFSRRYFINTEGVDVVQERGDIAGVLVAIAKEGDLVEQYHYSIGGINGFQVIEGLHNEALHTAEMAVKLLSAPVIKGGEYTVVLDPRLAGVFIHEAFGHLSEADHVYENEKLRELMVIGKRFGPDFLNVVDDPTYQGLRGSYKYDDEGILARKTYLIKDGILVGRLHSRETAKKMGESITGNARAINYRFQPIVRMSNTYIEPRNYSFEELISDIKYGIYAVGAYGGQTSMEMFTFSAQEGYIIENGKIADLVRDVVLTGNVFVTLQNIEGIANDLRFSQGGGCGKGGQSPLPVSTGSPHIRIRNVVIGGR